MAKLKLSIVIVAWHGKNADIRDILCTAIQSVIDETRETTYEILVSDNGTTDGSAELIEQRFSENAVRVIRNRRNLGFGQGNNAGFGQAKGEYVLMLNPDTIVRDSAIDKWMADVEAHPECGAYGIRLLYGDGSYQPSARPFPTIRRLWQQVVGMGFLGRVNDSWNAGLYSGWQGDSDRNIDWQSGACLMIHGDLLRELKGLDPQFFYHYEEVDLCYRIHRKGYAIRFFSGAEIVHLLGKTVQQDDRSPFQIETLRNRMRYFAKHYGLSGAFSCRRASVCYFAVKFVANGVGGAIFKSQDASAMARMAKSSCRWLWHLDLKAFLQAGVEPDLGFQPLVNHEELVLARQEWEQLGARDES